MAEDHRGGGLRLWQYFTCLLAGCLLTAALLDRGLPTDWSVIALAVAALLLLGRVGLDMPSRMVLTPSAAIVLGSVTALSHRDAIVGAFIVGACDGFDSKRFRARRWLLLAFNASQLGVAALASAVAWQALRQDEVLAVVVTSATYVVVNVLLVSVALAFQSVGLGAVRSDLRNVILTDPVFAATGLLAGQQWRVHGPIVLVLLVAAGILARVAFGFLARVRHAFTRLESLYAFTNELDVSEGLGDPVTNMLRQLSRRLGVRSAQVALDEGRGWTRYCLAADGSASIHAGTGPLPDGNAVVRPALASSLAAGHPVSDALASVGMGDGMVAPLVSEGQILGSLAVAGTHNQRPLTADDLRLLETFANHVAVFLERNRLVERLRHDSTHDQLTGLPNRRHFVDLVDDAERPTTVLLVNLDRFKEVNDTLGHDQGDVLLGAVADRLAESFDGAVVARLGGDEFGVLLPAMGSGDAAQAAVSLLADLEHPFPVGVLHLEIAASVGVAVAAADHDATKLLQQADVAMNSAKEAHSGWEVYSGERDHHSPWRLSLASDLRRGLDDELEVHFQPKARVADGRVCGVEALVRWRHPRYGLLSPDQFVAVAEQAGLIRPLTMAVLSEACGQQTRLEVLGFPLDIAINLSVRSVLDVNLPDQVAHMLSHHRIDPARLTLEITEGSLMADPARTIGVLGRLAATGIAISIDDFGTGYSSLGYLKRLPASEVKIDRSFVSGMLSDRSDEAIVRSTIDLAHNLGLRAVAEGIEDPATWAALAAIGCDEGQGYFLSAPLAAEALLPWLLRTKADDRL